MKWLTNVYHGMNFTFGELHYLYSTYFSWQKKWKFYIQYILYIKHCAFRCVCWWRNEKYDVLLFLFQKLKYYHYPKDYLHQAFFYCSFFLFNPLIKYLLLQHGLIFTYSRILTVSPLHTSERHFDHSFVKL